MNIYQYFKLLNRQKKIIAMIVVIFLSVAVLASALQPFKYSASTKLIIINTFKETDPYTASKSNEYLSNLLSQIVVSNSFFNKVKEVNSSIDKTYFKGDQKKQVKKWNKTAKAKGLSDAGIIMIDVYHPDPKQAMEIARSVAYVLQTEHANYHGFGQNIQIKMIDEPTASSFPVQPNIVLNFSLALIFGFLFAFGYIYLFAEGRAEAENFPVKKIENYYHSKEVVVESVYPEVYQNNNAVYNSIEEVGDNGENDEIEIEENFEDRADMNNILKK